MRPGPLQVSLVATRSAPLPWLNSAVAFVVSALAGLRIADTDIWVHLRNAKELLDTHSFLRADLYTFTSLGTPLVNFEWLSELPYYFAFRAWGPRGLLAVYLLLLWLVFGRRILAGVATGCRWRERSRGYLSWSGAWFLLLWAKNVRFWLAVWLLCYWFWTALGELRTPSGYCL